MGEELESEVGRVQAASEQRSKNNQDRESAREGLTRTRKRAHTPSGEEDSGKLPPLGLSSGKVAPMKKKKLVTLGGREANPPGGAAVEKAKGAGSGPARVAPPRRSLKTVHK